MKPLNLKVPTLLLLVALAVVSQQTASEQPDGDFSDLDREHYEEQSEEDDGDDDDDDERSGNRQANRQYGRLGEAYERTCGRAPIGDHISLDGNPRILSSSNAAYGEFPSYVRLQVGLYGVECGGTLISDRHVLSARHCLADLPAVGPLTVLLGDHRRAQTDAYELRVAGKKLCIDPKYSFDTQHIAYDWAVIELSKPVQFNDYVQPACLPRWPPTPKVRGPQSKCYLVGMGVHRYDGKFKDQNDAKPVEADQLKKVRLVQQTCYPNFRIPDNDPSRVCYARDEPGPHHCHGDSGGPILCVDDKRRWTIVAIASMARTRWCGAQPDLRNTQLQSINVDLIRLLPSLDDICKLPKLNYKPNTPPPFVGPDPDKYLPDPPGLLPNDTVLPFGR